MDAFISKFFGSSEGADVPGPGWIEDLGYQTQFIRDQVATFRGLFEEYGPVVRFHLGWMVNYLVVDPELIEEVLVRKADSFHKDIITQDLRTVLGNGLLTAEGETWRRHRKMMAPSLQRRQIQHYADVMVEEAERAMADWEDGERRRLDRDVTEMTLRVVVQALFDLDFDKRIDRVGEAFDVTMEHMDKIAHTPWRFVPDPIPTPTERAFEEAVEELDAIIYELIDRRRERDEPGDDLLYKLIEASEDADESFTDEQLRDQVITLFLAGHETTSLAVTYGWYLLAEHPEKAQRVHEEVDEVLAGERPTAGDVRDLEYVDAVFKESLRLYPPAWIIGRQAIEPVEVGDISLQPGEQVLMPQVVSHRNSEWFDAPESFRPERWLEGLEDDLPRFAYYPFGGGPRVCIGNHFAGMEAVLLMATMAQEFEFEKLSPETLETETSMTQRPVDPVEMRVRARE